MITAVYFDTTDGRIDQILPFDDGTAGATIDGFANPGTIWLDLPTARIREDYIADPTGTPTLTERPVLYDTDHVNLPPDGSETITFPVPSGTLVDQEDADDYTTAGEDFTFTPPGIGEWVFGLEPPWPYLPLLLTVTAVTRQVQTVDVAAGAIVASKKVDGDSSDMVPDPEMADLLSWFATADTGETINVFANAFNASAEGYGQSKYYLYAEASGGTDTRISTPPDIPVIPGAQYDVSGFAGPYSDSQLSDTGIGMGVNFYTMDGSGAYTYDSGVSLSHGSVPGVIGGPLFHSGLVTVPAGCTRAAIFGASGTATVKIVSFSFRRRSTIYFQAYTEGDFGSFGASSQQTVQSKAVAHGPNAAGVEVTASFRNTTGSGRTFLVEIYAGGTLVAEKPGYVLADDDYADIFGVHENPGGTSTTYTLKVTSAGTGNNVANRRLIAKVAK